MLESIYLQPPSPEVDAAWKRISSLDPVAITADEVLALEKDPSTAVKFPESLGLGPEAFVAGPNAMHQIVSGTLTVPEREALVLLCGD